EALAGECVKANVLNSISETLKRSELVRSEMKSGKLKVIGAMYDIESGSVNWLGAHPQEAELLSGEGSTSSKRDNEDSAEPVAPKLKGVNTKSGKKHD